MHIPGIVIRTIVPIYCRPSEFRLVLEEGLEELKRILGQLKTSLILRMSAFRLSKVGLARPIKKNIHGGTGKEALLLELLPILTYYLIPGVEKSKTGINSVKFLHH